jgi:uncharacterized protein YjdB
MRRFPRAAARCAILLAAAVWIPAAAEAARVTAGTGSALAGQTVDITLSTTDLSGAGVLSYQLTLTYNGALVSVVDALESGTLTETAGWGDATFNATGGQVRVSHAGTTALSGSGPLLRLRFLVSASATSGGFTNLVFQDFVFNEGAPLDTTANGSINVPATPVISVTPSGGELIRGQTLQFFVSGSVTPPVSWGTTQPSLATISGSGLLTAVAPGAVRVFAQDGAGRRDTTDSDLQIRGMGMTVGAGAVLQGQSVSVPVTVTNLGGLGIRSGQFRVTYSPGVAAPTGVGTGGTLLDGYGTLQFDASAGVLTVDFAGTSDLSGSGTLCRLDFTAANAPGSTSLILTEALFNETLPAVRSNGSLTVNGLAAISVNPETANLLAGQTQQFTLSGSPSPPVTWSTLDPAVATIDAGGLLTAIASGVTRVRAVDDHGASDENTSVTVQDFLVTVGTVNAAPGSTVQVPLLLDRNVDGLGIQSVQYTLDHSASHVSSATADATGLVSIWGSPAVNSQSGRVRVATAGSQALGTGTTLHHVSLTVSPGAPVGADVPLVLSAFLCNEGRPAARLATGLLRIRSTTGVGEPAAAALELGACRPNPAAGSARFAFRLPVVPGSAPVRLLILGIDGRLVRTLLARPLGGGAHEVAWDGRDQRGARAAAGIYLCRLEWNGAHRLRRFALLP